MSCAYRCSRPIPLEIVLAIATAGFWERATRVGSCLIWSGASNAYGYGRVSCASASYYAHRVAFTLAYGLIPAGMTINHSCNVRDCIEPTHLIEMTDTANRADAHTRRF